MCLMHVDAEASGYCTMLAMIGGMFMGDPARCL